MPRLQRGDDLAREHRFAGDEFCDDRLIAREQPVAVRDRQHPAIDDGAGEMHRSVGGRPHFAARGADVDAAVPGRVPRERREVGANDRVRSSDRPGPARGARPTGRGPTAQRRSGRRNRRGGQRDDQGDESSVHPSTLLAWPAARRRRDRSARIRPSATPVREATGAIVLGALCESTATTRARCDSRVAQRHPLSHCHNGRAGCVPGTRFAADRPR